MADDYNINISANVKIDEVQKLIAELNALTLQIADLNKTTLSGIQRSMEGLASAGTALTDAIKTQTTTFDALKNSSDKAADGLKIAGEETDKFANRTINSRNVLAGFYMELGAMGARLATQLPNAIGASIRAFGEQEVALQKLTAAIRANGGNVAEVVPIFREFAAEMQRATVYGDEQVLAMQSVATSMGVLPNQMRQVIQSAIGLSTALGMDLQTATRASAAAVQGKTEILSRYIPVLSECKTDEEKFARVQELSRSGFAQAKAEAESTAGKLKQCANAWGDLSETVGGMFAPVAKDVASLLKSLCEWFSKNDEYTAILTGTITSLAVSMAFSKIGGLTSVITLLKLTAGAIMGVKGASDALNLSIKANPIGLALTAAATAITGIVSAYSYFKGKAEETYKANIEKSKEYRGALDAEIETIKQWGITYDANRRRAEELRKEISKYETLLAQSKTRRFGESQEELAARTDNYRAKIEKLREVIGALSNAQELNKLAEDRQSEALKKSGEILKKNAEEMEALKSKTSELEYVRKQYAETEQRIAELDGNFKSGNIAVSERVAKAAELASARKRLAELGEKELSLALELNKSNRDAQKISELAKQYSLEKQIAEAVSAGENAKAIELQKDLAGVQAAQQRLDIVNAYVESLKSTVKTDADIANLQKQAEAHADSIQKQKQAEAAAETWLSGEAEAAKTRQRGLEMDILRARASGNEAQAKELEGELRIAQLSREIFDNARKEGMSKQQLAALQNTAAQQARERYDLEKSITEEAERQNLAKNAQAKIEDIILANKIEQLKSEGKITEAQELEREREIKRTLAGLGDAVSEKDKAALGNMMRQTNAYKDNPAAASPRGQAGGRAGFDGETAAALSRKNSLMSGGGGTLSAGDRQRGTPATVSAKNAGLYAEYQAAKKAGSATDGWNAFRDARQAAAANTDKRGLQASARGFLAQTEDTARQLTSRSMPQKPTTPAKPAAASSALSNKLESMGAQPKAQEGAQTEGETVSVLKEIKEEISAIHNDIKTQSTKKD